MATTDQNVLNEAQYHLLETPDNGASWPSGLWTVQEAIDAINFRQRQFLRDTQLLLTPADIVTIPNVLRHDLPQDWICTADVTFQTPADVFTEMPRGDGWQADHGNPDWPLEMQTTPDCYMDGELPVPSIQIAPATLGGGILKILYVALTGALSNTGVNFSVPDEFVPAIKWGAISDLLSKVGRGQDLPRAGYAQARYLEGVEAARIMLSGWEG